MSCSDTPAVPDSDMHASETNHIQQQAADLQQQQATVTMEENKQTVLHSQLPASTESISVPDPEKTPTMETYTQMRTSAPEAEAPAVEDTISRDSSPQPSSSLSPSYTTDGCPQLDPSASTASSVSSISGRSTSSRLSDGALNVKKRGYMRPQATTFSDSAKNRESVMSLGSIAHLQYYFARTGLLDGKGGQLARKDSKLKPIKTDNIRSVSMNIPPTATDSFAASPTALSDGGLVDSPTDAEAWDAELAMLPPTVSTYNQRPAYVPPPPDLTMLRRELTEALEDALKVLKETDKTPSEDHTQGWFEIQGLHLLDITTLAIRAAKTYYTAHSASHRLHAIKSEREIRQDLYQVLEILKRMASRNFAGGMRANEKVGILTWIVGISELIATEIESEKQEAAQRARWAWRVGDWTGREREREHAFVKCFIEDPEALPEWTELDESATEPTPFLLHFQNGLRLVKLHNACVEESKRHFELIKTWHSDTNKPYRCAENLRFWIMAAQLRWETHLNVDVMGVVQGTDMAAWRSFDAALIQWCKTVREELTAEMEGEGKRTPPRVNVESEAPAVPAAETTKVLENEVLTSEPVAI